MRIAHAACNEEDGEEEIVAATESEMQRRAVQSESPRIVHSIAPAPFRVAESPSISSLCALPAVSTDARQSQLELGEALVLLDLHV